MKTSYKDLLLIGFAGIVLFVPLLGSVHLFDWDEINFAESAREMMLTGDYFRVQINFQPFWEKPPLFIWLQVLSMKVFGVNEFAARFPNALIGIATLLILFSIGKKHFSRNLGWWWILAYAGSFLPHLYFKSGIIDPLFNLCIFLGVYFLALSSAREKTHPARTKQVFIAGIFIGLGVLTKGPVALLIALLTMGIYFIVTKSIRFTIIEFFLFFLSVGILSFAWFGVETIQHGPWFLKEFIVYQIRLFRTQDAGHGGPFFYHFLILYFGCFPASVFIFRSFRKNFSDNALQQILKTWFIISFFVVLILFSIVKTKIVHYSSFCYFPLTFLAAYGIEEMRKAKGRYSISLKIQLALIGVFIALVLISLPLILKNIKSILPAYSYLIKDDFALANLQAQVRWSGWEALIGLFYLAFIVIILALRLTFVQRTVFLFTSTALVISSTMYLIVPKIEKYSQGAAIEFFESMQNKDAYVDVYGYKSYAQLFYTKKKPIQDTLSIHEDYLLHGPVIKDVYLISKNTNNNLDHDPNFKRLREKNGFVFYFRGKTR